MSERVLEGKKSPHLRRRHASAAAFAPSFYKYRDLMHRTSITKRQTQLLFRQGRPEQRVFALDIFLVLRAARQDSRLAVLGSLASDRRSVRRCGRLGLGAKPCAAERSKCAEKVSYFFLAMFRMSFLSAAHLFTIHIHLRERGARALEAKLSGKTSAPHKDPEVARS